MANETNKPPVWFKLSAVITPIVLLISVYGMVVSISNFENGCDAYKQECFAGYPLDPNGEKNKNSCFIGVVNTTIGCATNGFRYQGYCSHYENDTFTCYSRDKTWSKDDNCPPNLGCASSGMILLLVISVLGAFLSVLYLIGLMVVAHRTGKQKTIKNNGDYQLVDVSVDAGTEAD